MSFVIKGKVVDESTGAGAPGVRVEAWDADQGSDDFVGWAVTDADGNFAIEFNELVTAELYDVWPDLYFRVYQSGVLLLDTYNSILWNVQDPAIEVTLTIPLCPTQPRVSRGTSTSRSSRCRTTAPSAPPRRSSRRTSSTGATACASRGTRTG